MFYSPLPPPPPTYAHSGGFLHWTTDFYVGLGRELAPKANMERIFSLLLQSLVLVQQLCAPLFYAPWQHFDVRRSCALWLDACRLSRFASLRGCLVRSSKQTNKQTNTHSSHLGYLNDNFEFLRRCANPFHVRVHLFFDAYRARFIVRATDDQLQ
jgi:hypothetical protein